MLWTEEEMWIDTNNCDESFHQITRDDAGRFVIKHADDSECEFTELGVAAEGEEF
jgi:hypothetical protein